MSVFGFPGGYSGFLQGLNDKSILPHLCPLILELYQKMYLVFFLNSWAYGSYHY